MTNLHLLHNPARRGLPRHRGYTLIELLIVVGVLGLAGALLVPSLVGGDSLAIQSAVRMIVADLTFAQSDALAQQEWRRVHFYDDGSGYCIVRIPPGDFTPFDPGTADYVTDPLSSFTQGGYIVDFTQHERFEGLTIDSVAIDGSNSYITYDDLGGTVMSGSAPGIGGEIIVSSPNESYRIIINAFTGRLTVENL